MFGNNNFCSNLEVSRLFYIFNTEQNGKQSKTEHISQGSVTAEDNNRYFLNKNKEGMKSFVFCISSNGSSFRYVSGLRFPTTMFLCTTSGC